MDKTKEKRCSTSWAARVRVSKRFDLIKIRCLEIIFMFLLMDKTLIQKFTSEIHISPLHIYHLKKIKMST